MIMVTIMIFLSATHHLEYKNNNSYKCKDNYTRIVLNNDKEVDLNYESKFLTYFKKDHWVVVDGRGRRDSKKAQYKDFCLDQYITTTHGHQGTVAITCEQNEENYCKENQILTVNRPK